MSKFVVQRKVDSVGKQTCDCAKDACEYVNKENKNYQNEFCRYSPLIRAMEKIDKSYNTYKSNYNLKVGERSVFEKEIWNAAIEEAALIADNAEINLIKIIAADIRGLKK